MAKNAKRNARTLLQLQLRAEFLGISSYRTSSRHALKVSINNLTKKESDCLVTGPLPFLQYLIDNDLSESWESFIKKKSIGDSRIKRIANDSALHRELDRETSLIE